MALFFVEGLDGARRVWWAARRLSAGVVAKGEGRPFLEKMGVEVVEGVEGKEVVVADHSPRGVQWALGKGLPLVVLTTTPLEEWLPPSLVGEVRGKAVVAVPDFPPPFSIAQAEGIPLGPTVYVNDLKGGSESAVVVDVAAQPFPVPFPAVVPKGFASQGGKAVEDVRPFLGNARVLVVDERHSPIAEGLGLGKPLVVVGKGRMAERVEELGVGVALPEPSAEGLAMAVELALLKRRAVRVFERAYRKLRGWRRLAELVEGLERR